MVITPAGTLTHVRDAFASHSGVTGMAKMVDRNSARAVTPGASLGSWRTPAIPRKWFNLTKMAEISHSDFRNFSGPERFQCNRGNRREPESPGRKKAEVQSRRWL